MLAHIWLSWTTKIILLGRAGAPVSLVMVRAHRNAPRERNWAMMEIARCARQLTVEHLFLKTLQGMELVPNVLQVVNFGNLVPKAAKLESSGRMVIVTSSPPPTGSVTRVLLGNTRRRMIYNMHRNA